MHGALPVLEPRYSPSTASPMLATGLDGSLEVSRLTIEDIDAGDEPTLAV
jgi:hypothetical protein